MLKVTTKMLVATVLFVSIEVLACTCLSPPAPEEALQEADVVIAGKVIAADAPGYRALEVDGKTKMIMSDSDMVRWLIKLSLAWKGEVADTIAVYSPQGDGACGYQFKIGEEYVVYADSLDSESSWWPDTEWPDSTEFPVLITGDCTRTRLLQDATEDLSQLHKPRPLQ